MKKAYYIFFLVSVIFASCIGNKKKSFGIEDGEAKRILQGVWINEYEEIPSFMAKGDSIFYPDTASMPARFWINNDSLYIKGNNVNRYKIISLSEDLFEFQNQNSENIKLVHDNSMQFNKEFRQARSYALNVFRTYDTDTVVSIKDNIRTECKIHLEPTSERVIKSSYNDDGIEVDNLYLDNAASLEVWINDMEIYTHVFRKHEFAKYIPQDFINKSILRELQYSHTGNNAVFFNAVVGIPDASTCYVIELKIDRNGKLTKKLK